MPHTLRNKRVTIRVDLPLENYQESRFDWTGKIVHVEFEGIPVAGCELPNKVDTAYGQGFYNEFGMVSPIGFDEIDEGQWFHKIGVGLLRKDSSHYNFQRPYPIQPADFRVQSDMDQCTLTCRSELCSGYAYLLEKNIRLLDDGFAVYYELHNTGKKAIATEEYAHNFISINAAPISADYQLNFPFEMRPELFGETVNGEGLVEIGARGLGFLGTPKEPFFFSNLSGNRPVNAAWTLKQTKSGIGIREIGDFLTSAVNLWGSGHVISPELFMKVQVQPEQSISWTRKYQFFTIGT